jgi:glucose-6-phosphate isomerase
MTITLNDNYLAPFVTKEDLEAIAPQVQEAHNKLMNGTGEGNDFLGWIQLPLTYDREEVERIKATAKKIQKSCDVFLVVGIGGSYLGARAAIEFCTSSRYNELKKDTPNIYFSGNDISASNMAELLSICEGKDICVNIISKSGTTTEPAIAFRIFRSYLEKKYGEEGARDRIFVTTDKAHGKLKELADAKGYETFVVPDDIGGRYSVLTPVGLLPIAVAGIDIDQMLKGALDAKNAYTSTDLTQNDCYKYAALRNILHKKGKSVEILASYESSLSMTAEWWKQLYGESEGKNGKGIFPASVSFTTDLHSMGQFIQEGSRVMFETIIDLKNSSHSMEIPYDMENSDGLNFIAGKDMHYVCRTAFAGTVLAHTDGETPNIVLELEKRGAYEFGYLVYFFELACGISGYMLGVNPFNQPGVEAYKKNMFALLGKPGYEELRKTLLSKM